MADGVPRRIIMADVELGLLQELQRIDVSRRSTKRRHYEKRTPYLGSKIPSHIAMPQPTSVEDFQT